MSNNIITIGDNVLNVDLTSDSYESIELTNYTDILKNTSQGVVLISNNLDIGKYTVNGDDWINVTIPIYSSGCYGNNKFCLIYESTIYISTYPFNWESTVFTLALGDYWDTICYGSLGFLVVSSLGVTAKSLDGISWTLGTIPSYDAVPYISQYSNGIYVQLATDLSVSYTSTDCVSWTQHTITFDLDTDLEIYKINSFNNKFYIVCRYTTGYDKYYLYESSNGYTWNIVQTIFSNDEANTYTVQDFINYMSSFIYLHTRQIGVNPEKVYVDGVVIENTNVYSKLVEGFPSRFWTKYVQTNEKLI